MKYLRKILERQYGLYITSFLDYLIEKYELYNYKDYKLART